MEFNWWLMELPYWFKAGFLLKKLEISCTRCEKANFIQYEICDQIEHRKIQKFGKTQKPGILKFYEFSRFTIFGSV